MLWHITVVFVVENKFQSRWPREEGFIVTAISVNNSLLDLPPSSFFGIRSDDLLFLIHSASTTSMAKNENAAAGQKGVNPASIVTVNHSQWIRKNQNLNFAYSVLQQILSKIPQFAMMKLVFEMVWGLILSRFWSQFMQFYGAAWIFSPFLSPLIKHRVTLLHFIGMQMRRGQIDARPNTL